MLSIITDDRIIRIPKHERIVKGSLNMRTPNKVATIGSIVASIPALLASTDESPRVYARKGITAVIKAVKKQNNINPAG